jgi:hypothetical protein
MSLPYQAHSPTSREAAEKAESRAKIDRRTVFEAIQRSLGLTDEEICDLTGVSPNSERPRRGELVNAGLVRDSGSTRLTKAGRNASVWVSLPGMSYEEALFSSAKAKPQTTLTGEAKAVDEIKRAIPESKRSPELTSLLERLDYETSGSPYQDQDSSWNLGDA